MTKDEGSSLATQPRHPIGVVSRRTGLKPDLIRAWERRYGAVAPGRSDTRRRFYSDADIERLNLLRRAVKTGHGISQVAGLANEELQAMIAEEPAEPLRSGHDPLAPARLETAEPALGPGDPAAPFLSLCLEAARRLDAPELELQIERASVALSRIALIEKLLVPLLQRVGDLWQEGTLRPVHEHLASAVVRSFLGGMSGAYHPERSAPHLVVTTPARQRHELGALIAAATAGEAGWNITYLGPDLPPEEIAAAALQKDARAVALSLTYPPDDPQLIDELRRLRRLLSPQTELIVGGRCAAVYAPALKEIGALQVEDLSDLRRKLVLLRSGNGSHPGSLTEPEQ